MCGGWKLLEGEFFLAPEKLLFNVFISGSGMRFRWLILSHLSWLLWQSQAYEADSIDALH